MAANITAKNSELKFKPEFFSASIRFSGYFLYYKNRCVSQKYIAMVGKGMDIKQAWQRYWIRQVDKIIDGVLNNDVEDYTINAIIKKLSAIDSYGHKEFWIQRLARNLFVGDIIKPFADEPEFTIASIVQFGDTLRIGHTSNTDTPIEQNFYINKNKQVSCLVSTKSKLSETEHPF